MPQMAIEEAQLIKGTLTATPPAHPVGPVGARQAAAPAPTRRWSLMAAARTPEEIRRSIEANRAELGMALERLRAEVAEATDWRKQFNRHRKEALIGAAAAGFVLGGGIAAITSLISGGGNDD